MLNENTNSPTWDDLKKQVDEVGGLLSIQMAELKAIHGDTQRLGKVVNAEISLGLFSVGLSCTTRDLPTSKNAHVRIFSDESVFAKLWTLAQIPGRTNDKKILGILDGAASDEGQILEKNRMLLKE